jgi:hypothetical protein
LALFALRILHARAGEAEHRAGNAGLVHGGKPHFAEVGQSRECLLAPSGRQVRSRRIPIVDEARSQEVFFQRDFLHHASSRSLIVGHHIGLDPAGPYNRYPVPSPSVQ